MSAQFITADVWGALSKAARRSKKPAYVSVAYFGKGAADLLHLPAKSRLVVDASEAAVKQGQTNPAKLRRMRRRRVAVYSVQNLHARVFAFDTAVFIGSANVSKHSASVLQEAVLRVTDAAVLKAARDFVTELCLEPLGPKELMRLQKCIDRLASFLACMRREAKNSGSPLCELPIPERSMSRISSKRHLRLGTKKRLRSAATIMALQSKSSIGPTRLRFTKGN